MDFSLAELVKRKRKRVRGMRRVVRRTSRPLAAKQELRAIFLSVVRWWRSRINERIMPAYAGGSSSMIQMELEGAENAAEVLLHTSLPKLRKWVARQEERHRASFIGTISAATGTDISALLHEDDVRKLTEAHISKNETLLWNVSENIMRRVSQIIWQYYKPTRDSSALITDAATPKQVIAEYMRMEEERMDSVAGGSVVNLFGSLDQQRQEQADLDKFIWQHSGAENFRPEHKRRDGKVFSWNDPRLRGDLPGDYANCGCSALPLIEFEGFGS